MCRMCTFGLFVYLFCFVALSSNEKSTRSFWVELLPVDAPLMMCKAVESDLLWSSAALSHAAGLGWQSPHNGSLRLIKAKVLRGWGLWIRLKKLWLAVSIREWKWKG